MPNVTGSIANTPYIALSIVLSLRHNLFKAVDTAADGCTCHLPGPYVDYRRATDDVGMPRLYVYWQGQPRTSSAASEGPEFLQRSGGIAARLGAIYEQVLPFAMWNVWGIELVLIKMKLTDFGMAHAADSVPVPHVRACPHLTETCTGSGQFTDQRLH